MDASIPSLPDDAQSPELQEAAYEAQQRQAIALWRQATPSLIKRAGGILTAPAAWATRRLIPPQLIETVLRSADWIARKSLPDKPLLRKAGVETVEALRDLPLQRLDTLAAAFHRWALGYAVVEGGAAGAAGLAGLAADVPSLITLTLRTVRGIGACYGFTAASEAERHFVLAIVGAAGANSAEERAAALETLQDLEQRFVERTLRAVTDKTAQHALGKEAVLIVMRDLASQLGINLAKRKALQAVPIAGIAVGAAVNWSFINDVAWSARQAYQERWLTARDSRDIAGP